MTPAQKGAATRRRNKLEKENMVISDRAHELVCAIQKLAPLDESLPAVVALFKPGDWDAFLLMDQKPGRFLNYPSGHWYMLLRRCRNRPELGLFKQMK